MEFNAPPADTVLQILATKARTDPTLASQIDAATWQAIAMVQHQAAEGEPEADEDEDEDADDPV